MSSSAIRVFSLSLDSTDDINSKDALLLKNAFLKGPSKATDNIVVSIVDRFNDYSSKEDSISDNSKSDNKESDSKKSENNSYSIYSAYLKLFPFFEKDVNDSGLKKTSKRGVTVNKKSSIKSDNKNNATTDNKTQINTDSNKKSSETELNQDEEDSIDSEVDNAVKSFMARSRDEQEYNKVSVKVGIKKQGYTEWEIWVDKTVSESVFNLCISNLKSGKFLEAYNLVSKDNNNRDRSNKDNKVTTYETFIVKSSATYINSSQPENVPPFFGHCAFSLSVGSTQGEEESTTLMFCTLPKDLNTDNNARVNSTNALVKTRYKIIHLQNFMNNVLGSTANMVKIMGKSLIGAGTQELNSAQNKSLSTKINKFLRNKFNTRGGGDQSPVKNTTESVLGDEQYFNVYQNIVKFIQKCLKSNGNEGPSLEQMPDGNNFVTSSYASVIKSAKAFIAF